MPDPKEAAESVIRQEAGRISATLIRLSGSFDLAEEALQEAFAVALSSWPENGVPTNPAAWITAVAHRKLVDSIRREATRRNKSDAIAYETEMVLFDEIIGHAKTADITGRPPSIRRALSYIDTNLSAELSVETLAAVAKLSRAHFSRTFADAEAASPAHFVLRKRLEREGF